MIDEIMITIHIIKIEIEMCVFLRSHSNKEVKWVWFLLLNNIVLYETYGLVI